MDLEDTLDRCERKFQNLERAINWMQTLNKYIQQHSRVDNCSKSDVRSSSDVYLEMLLTRRRVNLLPLVFNPQFDILEYKDDLTHVAAYNWSVEMVCPNAQNAQSIYQLMVQSFWNIFQQPLISIQSHAKLLVSFYSLAARSNFLSYCTPHSDHWELRTNLGTFDVYLEETAA